MQSLEHRRRLCDLTLFYEQFNEEYSTENESLILPEADFRRTTRLVHLRSTSVRHGVTLSTNFTI